MADYGLTKRGTPRKRAGRPNEGPPKLEPAFFAGKDLELLRSLIKIHCTREEVAGVFGFSLDTLDRRLAEIGTTYGEMFDRYSSEGRASLRRYQFREASKGNSTMLVWLGKQWLGQKDVSRHEHGGAEGAPPIGVVVSHEPFQEAVLAALRERHAPPPESE